MRKLLLGVLASTALLLLLLFAALKTFESETVRLRIAAALTESMGQPVSLDRLSVTLLPAPALTARGIQIGTTGSTSEPGITASELHVVPSLASLLPGRSLSIASATLDSAVITARRDSTGRWLLPLPRHRPTDSSNATSRAAAIGLTDLRLADGTIRLYDDRHSNSTGGRITTINDVTASVRAARGAISVAPLSGRLGETRVRGAMLMRPDGAVIRLASDSIRPPDVPALLALMGVTSHPPISIAGKAPFEMKVVAAPRFASYVVTGSASAERMKVGRLDLERVATPFRLAGKKLELEPITFTAYGGQEHGSVTVDLRQRVPRYTIQSSLVDLDVRRALTATTNVKNLLHGAAHVSGDLTGHGYGTSAVQRNLAGTIRFDITDGVIRGFPALAAIGRALGTTTEGGENTSFQSFTGTATVGGGQARTNDLVIRAGELLLAGGGTVTFDRALDLRMIATLSPALSSRLTGHLGLLNRLADSQGRVSLPVTVRGTVAAPQISVDVRAVAQQQLPDMVRRGLLQLLERH